MDTYPALTYRFGMDFSDVKNSLFAIDRFSGKVLLKRPLDYEEQQEYQLEIIASDTAHEAKTSLTVRISDENDNAPEFQQKLPPAYFVMLSNEKINGNSELELLTVNATDADGEGKNSRIRYRLQPEIRGFSIHETQGKVYANLSILDSMVLSKDIFLHLEAEDEGVPSLKTESILRVRSSSVSGGRSQFLQSHYRAQINEMAPLGSTVLRFTEDVIDLNVKQRNLNFLIVSGNEEGNFEILASEALILVKPLDREKTDLYKLRLVMSNAEDAAQISFAQTLENSTSSINVFITVEDSNDNAPEFLTEGKYAAEISETAPLRYSIAQLQAVDADMENTPNSEVVYDITSGNDEQMFTIDLISGVLFVNNKLDYDTGAREYNLIIRACDSAIVPKCSFKPFHLQLKDENDNAPVFPVTEFIEFVAENEPVGTVVFTARASDADKGNFGLLNYSIVAKQHNTDDISWKLFSIDAMTGIVSTAAVFDYEQRHRYDFSILALDAGGKSSTVKVRIQIESRDEYAPQFTERTYRFVLPSGGYLPVGFVVGQVMANDRDKGSDGRVVYQLSSPHAYFKVNRSSGAVMIKKKLDNHFHDDGRGDISLVIAASSGKQGSLTNMTVVEIALDPLADPGTNLASSGIATNAGGGIADWVLGLLIALMLLICAVSGIFLFVRMRSRKPRNGSKPHLNTEPVGNSNNYVDPSGFDTIPIRGNLSAATGVHHNVNAGAAGQFAPPKYDEIPPYGAHAASSNSGAATTSELSGSEQSGSSGRGSAEDDGEDEEIRMINEGGSMHHRNANNNASGDGRLSNLSIQNTQEYLARLGIVDRDANPNSAASNSSRHCSDSMVGAGSAKDAHMHHPLHLFHEHAPSQAESDITNLIYAKLNEVTAAGSAVGAANSERGSSVDDAATTAGSMGTAVDHVMSYGGDVPVVNNGAVGGSLSSIVHSEEELQGSYNWDYLLDWGPQYQPLAHVFSEIARLKDDNASVHSGNSGASSSAKSKHSLASVKTHIPPPMLTNVAPRAINMPVLGTGMRMPPNVGHHMVNTSLMPRSPISHDAAVGFSTSSAMSPSFSPSLSPLATRSPSISPLGGPSAHHMVVLGRHAPQPSQRAKNMMEQEMRVRMQH